MNTKTRLISRILGITASLLIVKGYGIDPYRSVYKLSGNMSSNADIYGNLENSPNTSGAKVFASVNYGLSTQNSGNYVNTFTGQAAFNVPLGGVSNFGGLSYNLGLSYYSGDMLNKVTKPVKYSPHGLVGHGFNMTGASSISANLSGTTELHDDEYYISINGVVGGKLTPSKKRVPFGDVGKYDYWIPVNAPTILVKRNLSTQNQVLHNAAGPITPSDAITIITFWEVLLPNGVRYIMGNEAETCHDDSKTRMCLPTVLGKLVYTTQYEFTTSKIATTWYLHRVEDKHSSMFLVFDYEKTSEITPSPTKRVNKVDRENHLKSISVIDLNAVQPKSMVVFEMSRKDPKQYYNNTVDRPLATYVSKKLEKLHFYQSSRLSYSLKFNYTYHNQMLLTSIDKIDPVFGEASHYVKFMYKDFTKDPYIKTYINPAGVQVDFQYKTLPVDWVKDFVGLPTFINEFDLPALLSLRYDFKYHYLVDYARQFGDRYYLVIEAWWDKTLPNPSYSEFLVEFRRTQTGWTFYRSLDLKNNSSPKRNFPWENDFYMSPAGDYCVILKTDENDDGYGKWPHIHVYDLTGDERTFTVMKKFRGRSVDKGDGVRAKIFTFKNWFVFGSYGAGGLSPQATEALEFYWKNKDGEWRGRVAENSDELVEDVCPPGLLKRIQCGESNEFQAKKCWDDRADSDKGWLTQMGNDFLVAVSEDLHTIHVLTYRHGDIVDVVENMKTGPSFERFKQSNPAGGVYHHNWTLKDQDSFDVTVRGNVITVNGEVNDDGVGKLYSGAFLFEGDGLKTIYEELGKGKISAARNAFSEMVSGPSYDLHPINIKTRTLSTQHKFSGPYQSNLLKFYGDWAFQVHYGGNIHNKQKFYAKPHLESPKSDWPFFFESPIVWRPDVNGGYMAERHYRSGFFEIQNGFLLHYPVTGGRFRQLDIYKVNSANTGFNFDIKIDGTHAWGAGVPFEPHMLDKGMVYFQKRWQSQIPYADPSDIAPHRYYWMARKIKFTGLPYNSQVYIDDIKVVERVMIKTRLDSSKSANGSLRKINFNYDISTLKPYHSDCDKKNKPAYINHVLNVPNFGCVATEIDGDVALERFWRDIEVTAGVNQGKVFHGVRQGINFIPGGGVVTNPGGRVSESSHQAYQSEDPFPSGKKALVLRLKKNKSTAMFDKVENKNFTFVTEYTKYHQPITTVTRTGKSYTVTTTSYLHEFNTNETRYDLVQQQSTYRFAGPGCNANYWVCVDNPVVTRNDLKNTIFLRAHATGSRFNVYDSEGLKKVYIWQPTALGQSILANYLDPQIVKEEFLSQHAIWKQTTYVRERVKDAKRYHVLHRLPNATVERDIPTLHFFGGKRGMNLATAVNATTYDCAHLNGEEAAKGAMLGSYRLWAPTDSTMDGVEIDYSLAHSGNASVRLFKSSNKLSRYFSPRTTLGNNVNFIPLIHRKKGFLVSLWIYVDGNRGSADPLPTIKAYRSAAWAKNPAHSMDLLGQFETENGSPIEYKRWVKVSTIISYQQLLTLIPDVSDDLLIELGGSNLSRTASVYFDDIRVHPIDASFRSQNFNSEGWKTSSLGADNELITYHHNIWGKVVAAKNGKGETFTTAASYPLTEEIKHVPDDYSYLQVSFRGNYTWLKSAPNVCEDIVADFDPYSFPNKKYKLVSSSNPNITIETPNTFMDKHRVCITGTGIGNVVSNLTAKIQETGATKSFQVKFMGWQKLTPSPISLSRPEFQCYSGHRYDHYCQADISAPRHTVSLDNIIDKYKFHIGFTCLEEDPLWELDYSPDSKTGVHVRFNKFYKSDLIRSLPSTNLIFTRVLENNKRPPRGSCGADSWSWDMDIEFTKQMMRVGVPYGNHEKPTDSKHKVEHIDFSVNAWDRIWRDFEIKNKTTFSIDVYGYPKGDNINY